MFTGIIREIGTIQSMKTAKGLVRLTLYAPKTAFHVKRMESIAVNGVCLTVIEHRTDELTFEMIPQTRRLTALCFLGIGDRVNVEPSLAVSDRLNGHLVFGHVDGMGRVVKRKQSRGELTLTIRVPARLRRLLVSKAPIAVNGVSLTVGQRLGALTFPIHLIPETLRQTTLGGLKVGDRVNIEADYIAKLLQEFAKRLC